MRIIILDGKKMTDRDSLHQYLAHELQLPDYYGNNLDALADCLGEMGPHTHIILTDPGSVRENLGEYGARLIEVFMEVSSEPLSVHFAADGE